jgi:hypothetical protein
LRELVIFNEGAVGYCESDSETDSLPSLLDASF